MKKIRKLYHSVWIEIKNWIKLNLDDPLQVRSDGTVRNESWVVAQPTELRMNPMYSKVRQYEKMPAVLK